MDSFNQIFSIFSHKEHIDHIKFQITLCVFVPLGTRAGLSTSAKGRDPDSESVRFRRHAVEKDIECLTAIDTANALADCLESSYSEDNFSLVDIKNEINGLDILH